MSTALERQVIAQVLQNYVTAQNPAIPVDWPNKEFEKPQGQTWIRFTVKDQKGTQIEMGSVNNTHRVQGSLILQVFVPADSGDGAALTLCDTLGELYRQQVLNFPDNSGHVRMRDPVAIPVGRDGAFWQTNVVIPFHRDDLP